MSSDQDTRSTETGSDPATPAPGAAGDGTTATTATATATEEPAEATPTGGRAGTGALRILAILVIVGGAILMVAGAITYVVVQQTLSDENITVSEDADNFAGDKVEGPFTAYAEAEVINDHALEETDGLTYAELDRDDPRRDTVMTASFLRASLFTSVVSFGVAALAMGLGVVFILVGWALVRLAGPTPASPRAG
jgi:hypothetical protein